MNNTPKKHPAIKSKQQILAHKVRRINAALEKAHAGDENQNLTNKLLKKLADIQKEASNENS